MLAESVCRKARGGRQHHGIGDCGQSDDGVVVYGQAGHSRPDAGRADGGLRRGSTLEPPPSTKGHAEVEEVTERVPAFSLRSVRSEAESQSGHAHAAIAT